MPRSVSWVCCGPGEEVVYGCALCLPREDGNNHLLLKVVDVRNKQAERQTTVSGKAMLPSS